MKPQVKPAQSRRHATWPCFPLALPGERIGLLGGSFNPPHEGHRDITLAALARLALDRVWWLVTPGNPLKDHAGLAPLTARIAAAQSVADHPRIIATGVEADLGTSYTAQTLRLIRARHTGVHFVWLMGADNLAQLHRWRDWRFIMESMPVAVLDRPGWRLDALAAPAARAFAAARLPETRAALLPLCPAPAWTYLSIPLSPVSSTALRRHTQQLRNPPTQ